MITENNLRKKESEAIIKKAEFIETHSESILKSLESDKEKFNEFFLQYLISDNNDCSLSEFQEENDRDYFSSLEVIFKMCFLLEDSNLSKEQKENFRNKLRLYTKKFHDDKTTDQRKGNAFVKFNREQYNEQTKKLVKKR